MTQVRGEGVEKVERRGGLSMGCIKGQNDQLRGRGRWGDSRKDRWTER